MRRIFILTFFIIFLTGCSNIIKRKEFTPVEKNSLITLLNVIKDELKNGETYSLEEALVPSIRNNFVKDEIQNIDFSKVNILISNPVFLSDTAKNLVGVVVGSGTIYYDVEYELKDGQWRITKFKERRS